MDMKSTNVELCGKLADGIGKSVVIRIPTSGCRISEMLDIIVDKIPKFAPLWSEGKIKVCINEVICHDDDLISPQDSVALFPLVSGG